MQKLIKKINSSKISLGIILLYLIVPVIMIFVNYYSKTKMNFDIWFNMILVLGILSTVFGIVGIIVNRKDIKFKTLLLFIYIFIMLIMSLIAALNANNVSLALYGENYRHMSYMTYLLLFGFFMNAMNVSKKDYKLIAILFTIVSVIICVIALPNNDFTHKFYYENAIPYNGIFAHANHMGYYLSLAVIVNMFLFVYEKNTIKKTLYYLMLGVLLVTLIGNDTMGSYLAVLITIIIVSIYSLIKKKNFNMVFVVILLAFLSFTVKTSNGVMVTNNFGLLSYDVKTVLTSKDEKVRKNAGTKRMGLWDSSFDMIKEKPLLGYGPNNLEIEFIKRGNMESLPHNFILEVATYNGVIVLIIYVVFLLTIFIRNLIRLNNYNVVLIACMISYLISAFFGNMFFYTSPYFAIVLGMLASFLNDKNKVVE